MIANVKITLYAVDTGEEISIPLIMESLQAGFPSPAQNYIEKSIDLNKQLIFHPSSTFIGKIEGLSLKDIGLGNYDRVLIDKAIDAEDQDLILCIVNGEFTIKFLEIDKEKNYILLNPANRNFSPIKVNEYMDFEVFGVVTFGIRKYIKRHKRDWDS